MNSALFGGPLHWVSRANCPLVVALHDLTWFYELSLVVDVLHSTVIILQVLCMSAYYKATVNEIHVSGHPPVRNFNGPINWSLLVTYVIIGHVI